MNWSTTLQYRADLFLWTVAEMASPLVAGMVWYSVTSSAKSALSPRQTLTYYLFLLVVNNLVTTGIGFFLARDILQGTVVQYMVRPFPVIGRYVTQLVAEKLFYGIFLTPILVLILVIFHNLFEVSVFFKANILFFIPSLLMAIILYFVLDVTLATIAFWIEDANEIRRFKFLFESVASGLLIPFALMPPLARTIFSFLPFRYTLSAPLELLLGQQQGAAAWRLLGLQVAWLIGLGIVLRISWRRGLQRYAPPGQ